MLFRVIAASTVSGLPLAKEVLALAKKRQKREIIVSSKSEVSIGNASTEVTDVPPSSKEPAAQAIQVGQQGEDENQKWSWIYHCDEVISNLPIGLA